MDGNGSDWRAILWSLLRPALVAAIVALLVALGVTGLKLSQNAAGLPGDEQVGMAAGTYLSGPLRIGAGLQVGNNITMTGSANLTVGGSATVGGAVTSGQYVSIGTYGATGSFMTIGSFLRPTARSVLTVTEYITPTGTFQRIAAAAWVSPTMNAGAGSAGDVVVLINSGTENIFLQDTGDLVLAGDLTMGQWDSITLLADGTRWVELSRSNN